MNCQLAVWMATQKLVSAYCRVLYKIVWETTKPGWIKQCDPKEQAILKELAQANAA